MNTPISGMDQDVDRPVGTLTLRATCDAALAGQAAWLLDTLAGLITSEQPLQDGLRVRVGWTVFTLRQSESVFQVFTPDLRADPFRQETRSLNDALGVMAEMVDFLHQLHITENDDIPLFSQKVVLEKGVLEEAEIFLERRARQSRDDSGWFIGREAAGSDSNRYSAVRVYQLLTTRPELLVVMGLPAGHLAMFSGKQLTMVIDKHQQVLWGEGAK